MVWSTPPTAVFQQSPPYTWWNTYIRDNLLETAPGKATTAGYWFIGTGANSIAERAIIPVNVDTLETTGSTSYVDLTTPGPSVTMVTGSRALILLSCQLGNSGTSTSYASIAVSGATTFNAGDAAAIGKDGGSGALDRSSISHLVTGLTSGTNTFFAQYRVSGGTGTWLRRRMVGMGL